MPSTDDESPLLRRPGRAHWRPTDRHLRVREFGGTRAFREAGHTIRVAHLTDQHVGRITPDALQRAAIAAANDASPDLVLLTGDYVAHDLDHLDLLEEYLRTLNAPAYAVLGNHDHWTGPAEVIFALERAGVEVLLNRWTEVDVRGDRFQLVGLDDMHTDHADVDAATRGLDPNVPTVALSHVGEAADALWDRGASLVLSGHTHSGQIALARLNELFLSRFARHRYVHGLYGCRDGDTYPGALYVSAGIGSSRFSPRVGERALPEVAIFDLHVDPSERTEPFDQRPPLRTRE